LVGQPLLSPVHRVGVHAVEQAAQQSDCMLPMGKWNPLGTRVENLWDSGAYAGLQTARNPTKGVLVKTGIEAGELK